MTTSPTTTEKPKSGLLKKLVCLIIGLYVLDQVTKLLIVFNFEQPVLQFSSEGGRRIWDTIPVIDGYLNIVRVHNTGVAFGFGNGTAWSSYVFLAIPIIAIIALIWGYRKQFFSTLWMKIAWAFLLAGIFGNLTDRLIQGFLLNISHLLTFWERVMSGYVVDFIDVTIPVINYKWPAFNVADSCICIAAGIFLICSFAGEEKKETEETPEESSPKNPDHQ